MEFIYLAAAIFGLVLSVLWLLVPFAVFGIKPLLGQLLAEQRKTNTALATMSQQLHFIAQRLDGAGQPASQAVHPLSSK
ncbi:hypothetical protein [Xanthomonas cannabis]|uniref:hypothetical protein n=1 Tax=Xanthomonas cannabis TaxID=1885674 RepID=UPI000575957F|nr:hypothetical protein [Xanthomonas cannabis]KHL54774.1 hypothetical protein OZ13_13050 [Xanthomonas cannabis pv. cannabis]KHL60171.1 hypothetical protein OZ10_00440 [Xanthomonas cannabis pv. cannabis]MCC8442133.1 hypothetical protein [Xanthomonas cannabis]